jgi:hypothetical protein
LTLNNITPGDSVVFDIDIENKSNVDVLYRLGIARVADEKDEDNNTKTAMLLSQLEYKISTVTVDSEGKEKLTNLTNYDSIIGINSYYSAWKEWEGTDSKTVRVEVSLPITVGNNYKDIANSSVNFTVEAVQGNAYVDDDNEETIQVIRVYSTWDELIEILENVPEGQDVYALQANDITADEPITIG